MKIYLMLKKSHEKAPNHEISIKLLAFLKTFLEREETFTPIPQKHEKTQWQTCRLAVLSAKSGGTYMLH